MTTIPGDLPPTILVRRPSPRLAAGELTHLDWSPVDPGLALTQWQGYVEAFTAHGWAVREIAPADDHPDGVFVEDTVVVFDDLAVLTRPGAASRRGEVDSTEAALAELSGYSTTRLTHGHLDGGDVLKIAAEKLAYVGASARTDAAGLAALTALLEPRGWRVVGVPVQTVLHLKSAVTALPDGTVIGYEPNLDACPYPAFLPVPEEHGTAVVDLGDGAVLMSAAAPRTAALLRARSLSVVTVPIGEFEKLEGCVTCLSVRLRPRPS